MSEKRKKLEPIILDLLNQLQRDAKQVWFDLMNAKGQPAGSMTREKSMLNAIQGLCEMETITHELSEWWKSEYFKRQWASGFCFPCSGEGKAEKGKCSHCCGKGRIAPRKPKGDMIPSGWKGSAEDTKPRKRRP